MKRIEQLKSYISHYHEKIMLLTHYNKRDLTLYENRAKHLYEIMQHIDKIKDIIKEFEMRCLTCEKDYEAMQTLLGYLRRGKPIEPEQTNECVRNGDSDKKSRKGDIK